MDRSTSLRIAAAANVTNRFMQSHVNLPARFYRPAIHHYFIFAGLDFCAEYPNDLAVYRDPSRQNDLLRKVVQLRMRKK